MYGPYLASMSSLPASMPIDWGAVLSHAIAATVGSFFGAGFAFSLSLWQKRRDERRQNLAAGNLAVVTLAEQLGSFLDARKQVQANLAKMRDAHPNTPLWFQMMPPKYFPIRKDLSFDLPSLAFIFEKGDATVFTKLVWAEKRYANLIHAFDRYEQTGEAVQQKMENAGLGFDSTLTVAKLQDIVGPVLVARLSSFCAALLVQFDKDEADYKAAEDALQSELVRRFGEKGVKKIVRATRYQSAATRMQRDWLSRVSVRLITGPDSPGWVCSGRGTYSELLGRRSCRDFVASTTVSRHHGSGFAVLARVGCDVHSGSHAVWRICRHVDC